MMFYIFVTVLFTHVDWNILMNSTSGVVFICYYGHTLLHRFFLKHSTPTNKAMGTI